MRLSKIYENKSFNIFRSNLITHLILAFWPVLLALLITILWNKEIYLHYGILANTAYLISSIIDWGGVNARLINNSNIHVLQAWLIKISIGFILSLLGGMIFDKIEISLFTIAAFSNPQWLYVKYDNQKEYNSIVFWGRILALTTIQSSNFMILLPSTMILLNAILLLRLNRLNVSLFQKKVNLTMYLKDGFTFFLSKSSTTLWMYLPLLILTKIEKVWYLAYVDKAYQLIVLSSIPVVLTQIRGHIKLSHRIMKITGLIVGFIIALTTLSYVFLKPNIIFLYSNFSLSLLYLSIFGQGWIDKINIKKTNIVYSVSSLCFLGLCFYDTRLFVIFPLFFIFNFFYRAKTN